MKKRKTWKIIFIVVFLLAVLIPEFIFIRKSTSHRIFWKKQKKKSGTICRRFFEGEPKEVRELRKKQTASSDKARQEYYFNLLNEEEKKGYREICQKRVRAREKEFYLTIYEDAVVNKVYHACS